MTGKSGVVATFRVGSSLFGADVHHVQEVVRDQLLEPVPRAPSAIAGLINLRGQILAVIDLRSRLGFPPRPWTVEDSPGAHYIFQIGSELESLLVDVEGEVFSLTDFRREKIPDTMPAHIRPFVSEIYQLDHELLLVLDVDKVLQISERG